MELKKRLARFTNSISQKVIDNVTSQIPRFVLGTFLSKLKNIPKTFKTRLDKISIRVMQISSHPISLVEDSY